MKVRHLVSLSLAALLVPAAPALADSYPSRPITLIVPFPAGGVTDVVGREMAHNLTRALGQPVVVENRAGAGGNIGTQALARAEPDGYTLGILTVSAMSIAPHLYQNLGFDPETDFTPISNVVITDGVIVANSQTPFSTVEELVTYAKANPGKVSYASVGVGSIPHLTAEMFSEQTGVDLLHVPYRGAAPAMQDLLANQIDLSFETSLVSALNNIEGGRLKMLALTSPDRSASVPDVPTVAESGYPEFSARGWFGLFGPAGLPDEITATLSEAVLDALNDPRVIGFFENLGIRPDPRTPEDFQAFLQQEGDRWGGVASGLNIQLD